MTVSFSHLGICVSDLDRSLRFYCEGLGFEPVVAHQIGDQIQPVDGGRGCLAGVADATVTG